jgi:recombination protein RecT
MARGKGDGGAATLPAPTNGNGGGGPPAAQVPAQGIKAMLEKSLDRLEAAASSCMTPERIVQVVTTLVYRTPRLQECDPASILASVMRATSLGLDLEPAMNEAFLVPRWNKKVNGYECQFQPGYQGLRKLALQSGEISYIQSRLVHEGDEFRYEFDPDLKFRHVPCLRADRGPVTHLYNVGKLKSGDPVIEVMTAEEVEAIHRRSESYVTAKSKGWTEQGPWVTDWNEMGKKTVLKRNCKALPRSLSLAQAIDADDEQYRHDGPRSVVSAPPRPGLSRAEQMAAALDPPDEPAFAEGTAGRIGTEADDDRPADEFEGRQPGEDG